MGRQRCRRTLAAFGERLGKLDVGTLATLRVGSISLMKSENVEVIAGVNLPMLIRLEGARKVMPVHAAVAAAREAGRKYISVASEILGEAAA